MIRRLKICNIMSALALTGASVMFAQSPPTEESAHVAIQALADQQTVKPGQTFRVALVEQIQPGWHTYWINPGDAGQATKLSWTLPAGYRVDDIRWPVPQVFRAGSIVSYGYEGRVVLLQTVHAPSSLTASPAKLSVDAQWLACSNICIPEHGTAQIVLNPKLGTSASAATTALFADSTARLPRTSPWSASLRVGPKNLEVRVRGLAHDVPADARIEFLPLTWGQINSAAPQGVLRSGPDLILTLARGDLRAQTLAQLSGLIVVTETHGPNRQRGFWLRASASDSGNAGTRS